MSDTSALHVPLEPKVRKDFTAKAKQLGFDSVQAYVRVLIKAEVDSRKINPDINNWSEPSDEAAKRLKLAAENVKKNKDLSGLFTSTEDFMKDL